MCRERQVCRHDVTRFRMNRAIVQEHALDCRSLDSPELALKLAHWYSLLCRIAEAENRFKKGPFPDIQHPEIGLKEPNRRLTVYN